MQRTAEENTLALQRLQANVWFSACSRRGSLPPPAATIEEELMAYAAAGALLSGAPELFFEALEASDPSTFAPAAQAAFETTRAMLLAALGPTPDVGQSSDSA